MGLLLPTPPCLACSLFATLRATTTCIIILLRSLEDLGGAFDAPMGKCPPDRGSSDCVTGNPAPYLPSSPSSSIPSSPTYSLSASPISVHGTRAFTRNIAHSPTAAAPITTVDYTHGRFEQPTQNIGRTSTPRPIPASARSGTWSSGFSTPPLTPDDGSYSSGSSMNSVAFDSNVHRHNTSVDKKSKSNAHKDALDFLVTLFPQGGLNALPYAKSVSVSAPTLGAEFEGVVLELPGKPKTLYVDGKSAASVSLRESIVALLDLASENLECTALVIVLERSMPNLGQLLHSLMYIGGSVVTKSPFAVDQAFVLIGLEI